MQVVDVKFTWKHPARHVTLTGSFVDWEGRIPMVKEGNHWVTKLPLGMGTYEYKFIIDGCHWCYDVDKPNRKDEDGNINNFLTISSLAASGGKHSHYGETDPSDLKTHLQSQLLQAISERDQLQSALSEAESEIFKTWTLHQRTPISQILSRPDKGQSLIGSPIGVAGWIKTLRLQRKDTMAFVKVSDGSTWEEIQVIVDHVTPGFEYVKNGSACVSASVFVLGTVVPSVGQLQKIEIRASEFRLLGNSDVDKYPIAKKSHGIEFLRSVGHMRPRTHLIAAVTKVRNGLAWATHLFFQERGFLYIHTPLITAADCEGAGELFQITTLLKESGDIPEKIPVGKNGKPDYSRDFFKKKAFLTVSGQLNAEIYACAMGSVYTFGPTFRAENANTTRHLSEFWMIEPEIAFADLTENMEIAEQYVKFTLNYVLKHCPEELEYLEKLEQENIAKLTVPPPTEQSKKGNTKKGKQEIPEKKSAEPQKKKQQKDFREFRLQPLRDRLIHVIQSEFSKITYTEAINILQNSGPEFEIPVQWGMDLASEHERWMAEKHFCRPVIVRDYPKAIKAFYMRLNEDGRTVAAMDVLVPGVGELIGGSQREERLDLLEVRMRESGLDLEGYSWYLDLRRFGSVPHSGFGLGFERLVCYATGMENIRDAIPFPRFPGHADF